MIKLVAAMGLLVALALTGAMMALIDAKTASAEGYETSPLFTLCQMKSVRAGMDKGAVDVALGRKGLYASSYLANSGTDAVEVYEWHDKFGNTIMGHFHDAALFISFAGISESPGACD